MSPISRLSLATVLASSLAQLAQADVVADPTFNIDGIVIVWSADAAGNAPVAVDFIIADGAPDGTDIIAGDAFTVVTGSLVSTANNASSGAFPFTVTGTPGGDFNTDTDGDGTLDGDDAFSAFALDADVGFANATPQTSFYVASNTAFNISAEITDVDLGPAFPGFSAAVLNAVSLVMEVAPVGAERTDGGFSYGASAQPPHSGGEQAGFATPLTLPTLLAPTTVFTGNQRTAATPGSIADQSVRFDLSYPITGGTVAGYDLSLGLLNFGVTVEYTVFVP